MSNSSDNNTNKPNMFRINYQVMEGNNYAGGWGDRSRDVENLDDLHTYKNLVSVVPIYKVVEVFEDQTLTQKDINAAIESGRKEAAKQQRQREIELAEHRLDQARSSSLKIS